MNFNYRDFFLHNDDLHIIKEQLSIIDEMPRVAKENALSSNAKDVWNMYDKGGELDKQEIAKKLEINVDTVEKIIDICEKKFLENKTVIQIANEMKLTDYTIMQVLNNAIPDWKRTRDANFTKNAEEIYNLHKQGKNPDEIVNLINQNRERHLQIKLDKVNLVLKIVDIAKKQMENDGQMNALEIERQINRDKDINAIIRLIKKLGIGKIKYRHKFTEEQDAFILFNYLQKIGLSELTRKFNEKFSTESKKLNIGVGSIYGRLKDNILEPIGKGKIEISKPVLYLLNKYFRTVNIEKLDAETKNLLTHYIPPETVGGRDRTGTGTNRDMSAHLGTVQTNFNTMLPPYYKS